jgi:NDP-sugar pyrophosphorylase family protein
MSELFRVLKLGGEVILQVTISKYNKETFEEFSIILPEEIEKYFGQKNHVRVYR